MSSTHNPGRVAGLLYLLLLFAPLRLIYIPNKLFVQGNATATANNIAAHETLFRLGIVSDLFTATMAIFLTLALYRLLKGVDQDLARLTVILGSLMVTPIYFLNTLKTSLPSCSRVVPISSPYSTNRSATPSPCCSSVCITVASSPTRYFGAYGSFPSACWCTGNASFPGSWASG
jgi:Domain of unknown function (DUF4386)